MAQILRPWHKIATPHEDLRKGIPLDASAFAIHLDQVLDGRAPEDYRDPKRFFSRTYLTEAYRKMTVEVLRRLAGEIIGTSPGFNLTTQFGGGKTHFLALLYHLFRYREEALHWPGVQELIEAAGLSGVPEARVAVFIGNRFDFVTGVGRDDEPRRKTPWGDLAWQLGGKDIYELVKLHDEEGVVPGGEVLQKVLTDAPTLILMDECLSFIRRAREAGGRYNSLSSQFYSFLDVLSREIGGTTNNVLVVSLPLSEYEMTQEDETEFQRLSKLLDRLSKAVLLSQQMEIAEIVRRRLFEDIGDKKEIRKIARTYSGWVRQHRKQLPDWFPIDQSEMVFEATYPFHPIVLSVFERKWQSLPKFQRTRGILRLLALWVSNVYRKAFEEGQNEPLITLGTAPLEDTVFRAAIFEQLGEQRLEAAVISDIATEEAHAVRLDREAPIFIRRQRLHQKVAKSVFFESSGGQVKNEATLPEIRLALGGPDIEIGLIEQALEDLVGRCYYLDARGTNYWVSHRPTLNKILSDRRASLSSPEAEERIKEKVREAIKEEFKKREGLERCFFPDSSIDIPDVAALRLIIMAPERCLDQTERQLTIKLIGQMSNECGGRGRTYKSGLIFIVAEDANQLIEEARTLLALEELEDPSERERLRIEPDQIRELREKKLKSEKLLSEKVWKTYRRILFLDQGGSVSEIDLGLNHPSSGDSLVGVIIARLKQQGIIEEYISPDFLLRNWPPAYQKEWNTKSVRDIFYASPSLPRLLDSEALRDTIVHGVRDGKFGYAVKSDGSYINLYFRDRAINHESVEFSENTVLLPTEVVLSIITNQKEDRGTDRLGSSDTGQGTKRIEESTSNVIHETGHGSEYKEFLWEGQLPPQKWTQLYLKVLTNFANEPSLRIHVKIEVSPSGGISEAKKQEIETALNELGLEGKIEFDLK